jgi:hypothetical protein
MSRPIYLGDGVYAAFEGDQLKLSTSDGVRQINVIYLEPEVVEALQRYLKAAASRRL